MTVQIGNSFGPVESSADLRSQPKLTPVSLRDRVDQLLARLNSIERTAEMMTDGVRVDLDSAASKQALPSSITELVDVASEIALRIEHRLEQMHERMGGRI